MHLQGGKKLNIGTFYGKQESIQEDTIKKEFEALTIKTLEHLKNQEHVILVGDFNAKLDNVTHNITTSRNGSIMEQFLINTGLVVMNTSPICQGVWTRIDPSDENKKSILDYVLASREMTHAIQNI